ncbi:unnamed protein product [Rhizophagus irregularis]|uniref:BTB domain-containing protein n=1 Tax=Rhizophagus irregularis TaxID=588596 RepID=A0A916E242_9GLOM|nr:unnamed protein product [Rhizophagus irregularis]
MSSEILLLARLSKNFENLLLNSDNNHDMIINVGNESNCKTFYAHSLILSSQSEYFQTALSSDWIKKDGDKIIFDKPNVSPINFDIILKHLYCENFDELWEIVKNLVELIRFNEISSESFSNAVRPYSLMFSREMYENLLWNYIKPQQTNKSPRNKKLQPAVGGFGFGQTTQPAAGGFGFGQTTQPAAGGFGFSSTPPSGFGFGNRRR